MGTSVFAHKADAEKEAERLKKRGRIRVSIFDTGSNGYSRYMVMYGPVRKKK